MDSAQRTNKLIEDHIASKQIPFGAGGIYDRSQYGYNAVSDSILDEIKGEVFKLLSLVTSYKLIWKVDFSDLLLDRLMYVCRKLSQRYSINFKVRENIAYRNNCAFTEDGTLIDYYTEIFLISIDDETSVILLSPYPNNENPSFKIITDKELAGDRIVVLRYIFFMLLLSIISNIKENMSTFGTNSGVILKAEELLNKYKGMLD